MKFNKYVLKIQNLLYKSYIEINEIDHYEKKFNND